MVQYLGIRISALVGGFLIAAGTGIRCLQVFFLRRKNAGAIFKL